MILFSHFLKIHEQESFNKEEAQKEKRSFETDKEIFLDNT